MRETLPLQQVKGNYSLQLILNKNKTNQDPKVVKPREILVKIKDLSAYGGSLILFNFLLLKETISSM